MVRPRAGLICSSWSWHGRQAFVLETREILKICRGGLIRNYVGSGTLHFAQMGNFVICIDIGGFRLTRCRWPHTLSCLARLGA